MNEREQRGLALAALYRIDRVDGKFIVPSQSGDGTKYVVDPTPPEPHCSCPDHRDRGVKCKHLFAVEFVMTRETAPNGTTTVTKTVTIKEEVTIKPKAKPTYKQVWPAYNLAQTREKRHFQELLGDLCRGVKDPTAGVMVRGQKPFSLADRLFSVVFKVYSTVSTRRFTYDLQTAVEKGFTGSAPHYNSVCRFMEDPELTPVLRALIVAASLPLRSVETEFAVDSSGFSTCRFTRWFDIKYGQTQQEREWVKVHVMTGVKTNVITAVEILDKNAGDSPQLPPLLNKTREKFAVKEVSADAAYLSAENVEAITGIGATPFIAFKENSTGGIGGLFAKMFHYYKFKNEEFQTHYHKRSNVESTFSMVKAKFGDSLRSKSDTAMINEVLCKVLCHNIACLIQSMYELGIEPVFWADETDDRAPEPEPEPEPEPVGSPDDEWAGWM